jgi:L-alanine-DL-glutamate epimerase-like enolase superfamily enzyme
LRIKSITGYALAVPRAPFKWRRGFPAGGEIRRPFLLKIATDSDVEGYCFGLGQAEELGIVLEKQAGELIGVPVSEREAIWQKYWDRARPSNDLVALLSMIDVALWDIAGKRAGLPLYQVLGAYRHKIRAYASTFTQDTVEDYVRLAQDCVKRNYRAIKMHLFGDAREDIEACRAVRAAVGPDIALMLDASAAYTYESALWAGRELEKLGFEWFEEPVRDYNMRVLSELHRRLDVPLCVAEISMDGLWDVANHIRARTGSLVQAGWARKGGVTGLMKIAHLCEANGMRMQIHRGEIPSLHVGLAIANCSYVEQIVPEDSFHFCLRTPPIVPDSDGYVHPPEGPGLGYDIDWDEVARRTERTVSVGEQAQ